MTVSSLIPLPEYPSQEEQPYVPTAAEMASVTPIHPERIDQDESDDPFEGESEVDWSDAPNAPSKHTLIDPVPDASKCAVTATMTRSRLYSLDRWNVHFGHLFAYDEERDILMTHWGQPCWKPDPNRVALNASVNAMIAAIGTHEAAHIIDNDEEVRAAREAVKSNERAKSPASVMEPLRSALSLAVKEAKHAHGKFAADMEKGFSTIADAVFKGVRKHLLVPGHLWDTHDYIVNTPEGYYDIRVVDQQGELVRMPHDPSLYITKVTRENYRPQRAYDPMLQKVLNQYDQDTPGTAKAVMRYAGVTVTGDTEAKHGINVSGPKHSGKTTFSESLAEALGGEAPTSYVLSVDIKELCIDSREGNAPKPDLARGRGCRMLWQDEVQNCYISSPLFKTITSGGLVKARRMRENGCSYKSQLHPWMIGNEWMLFAGQDEAMEERVVPIKVTPPAERDDALRPYLIDTQAGRESVLARAMKSARAWYVDAYLGRQMGYDPELGYDAVTPPMGPVAALLIPEGTVQHRQDRRDDSNPLAVFSEDRLVFGDEDALAEEYGNTGRVTASILAAAWTKYREDHGGQHMDARLLMKHLRALSGQSLDGERTTFTVDLGGTYKNEVHIKGLVCKGVRMTDERRWALAARV